MDLFLSCFDCAQMGGVLGMKFKELVHWTEHTGISTPPWVNKDWQSVLHLMSKILADDLVQR